MDETPTMGYSTAADFTKQGTGLHPRDARGQYVSPKLTSKRNRRLFQATQ